VRMDEETGSDSNRKTGDTSPAFEAKLHSGGVEFGERDSDLLREIAGTGSLNAAASALGRSYSHAHRRLQTLETAFGTLVETQRGGREGGGSALTARADRLLARFERLRAEFSGVAEVTETVFRGEVVDRTGSVAVVETDAGRLHAVAAGDASAVNVTVRADTVTLHRSGGEAPAGNTSARNQLTGTVVGIEGLHALARVEIAVGADRPLTAVLTARSRRELSLDERTGVVASFKTTATRVTPRR
jgi:molybdate transport system regulatory protein